MGNGNRWLLDVSDQNSPFVAGEYRASLRRAENQIRRLAGGENVATVSVVVRDGAVPSAATITLASCPAQQVININGVDFIAVSGSTVALQANNEFDMSGNDTADAAALAAAINGCTDLRISGVVTATSALGVVTLASVLGGKLASGIVVRNKGILATATVTAAAVNAADTVTVGGVVLTAHASTQDATHFKVGATDIATAANLVTCIGANTTLNPTGASPLVNARQQGASSAVSAVVIVQAHAPGLLGNVITLASSNNTRLAVSAARLAGATEASLSGVQASGTITLSSVGTSAAAVINGVSSSVTPSGGDTATAVLLAAAINLQASSLIHGSVYATSSGAVVTVTAIKGGPSGNLMTLTASAGTGTATASGSGYLTSGAIPTTVVLDTWGESFAGNHMNSGADNVVGTWSL